MSSLAAGTTEIETGRKVSEENQESRKDRDRKPSTTYEAEVNDKDISFEGNEQE